MPQRNLILFSFGFDGRYEAINEFVALRKPGDVGIEDLAHQFIFDKLPGLNRRLSSWTKGVYQLRLEFKSKAKGFRLVIVNAAYGSQGCPKCDYVDRGNRKGARFECMDCGFVAHADWVGARNVYNRMEDEEITRFTPVREVKKILLNRHSRRLEMLGTPRELGVTVQGRL